MSKKRGDLKKLLKLVQYLSTELDPQMSILNLNAFLTTAVNEDVATMMDLRDQLDNYGGCLLYTSDAADE